MRSCNAYKLRDKADDSVVADGESVVVWVDYEKAKAQPLPDELVDAIARIENNAELRSRGNNDTA